MKDSVIDVHSEAQPARLLAVTIARRVTLRLLARTDLGRRSRQLQMHTQDHKEVTAAHFQNWRTRAKTLGVTDWTCQYY